MKAMNGGRHEEAIELFNYSAGDTTLDQHNNNGGTTQLPNKRNAICDPIPFNLLAYFAATAAFLLSFNIWDMPKLPFPLIGNLLPSQYTQIPVPSQGYINPAIVLLFFWGAHYVRRFAEVMFVHKYRRFNTPLESAGVGIYYAFFGFWMGWAMNIHLDYRTPKQPFLVIGILLFLVGEIGNFSCHIALRRLRTQTNDQDVKSADETNSCHQVLPSGFLFKFVSCPHYLFEIITWTGYAIASFTMASFAFLLATCVTVCVYAYKRHSEYKRIFRDYPKRRKAIIPFIF